MPILITKIDVVKNKAVPDMARERVSQPDCVSCKKRNTSIEYKKYEKEKKIPAPENNVNCFSK